MFTLLRRLFWLGLIGGAGYAGWSIWQRQSAPAPAAPPEWPPMPAPTPPPSQPTAPVTDEPTDAPVTNAAATDAAVTDAARWVEPVDGRCPEGYPIKANDKSGIYHVPGGRFYDRTIPERCYADTDAAEADGYRAAKA